MSYLNGKINWIFLNGYLSYPFFLSSGVPQCSILDPFLFLFFMNDLLYLRIQAYADELKLFSVVGSPAIRTVFNLVLIHYLGSA